MENTEIYLAAGAAVPLWARVTHPLADILNLAFGCHHRKLSRIFTLEGRCYKVCVSCGAKLDYSLRTMSLVSHPGIFPALLRLRSRRRYQRQHRAA
jgi:hypothetical protein